MRSFDTINDTDGILLLLSMLYVNSGIRYELIDSEQKRYSILGDNGLMRKLKRL